MIARLLFVHFIITHFIAFRNNYFGKSEKRRIKGDGLIRETGNCPSLQKRDKKMNRERHDGAEKIFKKFVFV
jgi:hypothetical protein